MSEKELEKLRLRAETIDNVIALVKGFSDAAKPEAVSKEALASIIRQLESQKRMVEFAIYSREKAT